MEELSSEIEVHKRKKKKQCIRNDYNLEQDLVVKNIDNLLL
jgi:hypothetical protein